MELLVYKASAGSGKTFTLATEYIKLLCLNPLAYRHILAVTFTNKATAEMKARILGQLEGIAKGAPASEAYFRRVADDLRPRGLSDDDIRRAAATALHYMLHDYSRFRVETIDSFFQSVMRNLARELELTPNPAIELNSTEVLSTAVDSMIERLTPTSPVLAWLLRYIDERIADDKRWHVADEIKRFGHNLFNEEYIERGRDVRRQLDDPTLLPDYRRELHALEQAALAQMAGYHRRFIDILSEHALLPDDLKGGVKGIGSYFGKLRDGRLSDKECANATLENCLNDPQQWAAKTSPRRADIVEVAAASLIPLLSEAEAYRRHNARISLSCRLSLQNLNQLQLLSSIDTELRRQNHEQNRFLLADTNALLHRLISGDDSSFVFEKIGAAITHVMIDEFQDTSRMQWENFRILLLEGLSQGADSLIVGDVKQSIYRWRGGDWQILNELGPTAPFPYPVRVETLRNNRRSRPRIIGFNNRLFRAAVTTLNETHLRELGEACEPLLHAYADVEQATPRTDDSGYVKLSLLPATDDYADATLDALATEVARLLDSGIRRRDIAILVRKNKSIPLIARHLEQTLHLPVVSDEAFRLDASAALCLLMDALRLLATPGDGVSRAALLAALPATAVEALEAQAPYLLTLPLYELLEALYGLLSLDTVAAQDAYLFAFFDAATDYLSAHSSDLDAFIRHWDDTLSSKTVATGTEPDGIRILSIHKSKGLEFHTVLVPFCDWKLENETYNQLLWCTPTKAPFDRLSLVPVNYSLALAESVYRADYLRERLQLWVDNLNLLYVALTRAECNLIIWGRAGRRNTIGELLQQSMADLLSPDLDYETGTLVPSPADADDAARASSVSVHMQSLRPTVTFRQSNLSADFIGGVDDETQSDRHFIRRGQLLHALFADIATVADIEPAIARLVMEGVISSHDLEAEIRALALRAFEHPQARGWYDGSWTVLGERDIIWQADGRLQTRRPDRVMMRDGQVVVVDFKFGHPHPRYATQVSEYMSLLARTGISRSAITGYLWYVDQNLVTPVN